MTSYEILREMENSNCKNKSECNRLNRKLRVLKRREEGRDARWNCGIQHGGCVPKEKREEYEIRKAVIEIQDLLDEGR
jgi:hypothetical protein